MRNVLYKSTALSAAVLAGIAFFSLTQPAVAGIMRSVTVNVTPTAPAAIDTALCNVQTLYHCNFDLVTVTATDYQGVQSGNPYPVPGIPVPDEWGWETPITDNASTIFIYNNGPLKAGYGCSDIQQAMKDVNTIAGQWCNATGYTCVALNLGAINCNGPTYPGGTGGYSGGAGSPPGGR